MENLTPIIIGVLVGGVIAYLFLNKKKEEKKDTGLDLILQQVNELAKVMDSKLGETRKEMHETLHFHSNESNKIIREITEELVRVGEGQKQVVGFADQLQDLQNILKNPKQRGILGEYYLETVLKNVLPPGSYQMQYAFPDGTMVDAVVFVKDKIIPIDSKFSLENYNKIAEERDPTEKKKLETIFVNDLKNRITETAKYVQPAQGTTDFAFMFIPHEAIYYDLLINKIGAIEENTENLIQRAAGKYKVIITSPTSFLAYLQTVLQGLKALQIEESAKEIVKKVEDLGRHLKSYDEYHAKLGNAIATTVNHYNASGKELKKVDKDVLRIAGSSPELSQIELERPKLED
jgi:DNA recombination protein RmuC